MKQPTLSELADKQTVSRLVTGNLHAQLGIENNSALHQGLIEGLSEEGYQSLLAHVSHGNGRGIGSYGLMAAGKNSGWGLGNFIDRFSSEIATVVLQEGEKECGSHVRKFRADKTKLPQGVIDHVWMQLSKLMSDKISEVHESQNYTIPGLEEAVRNSPILPAFGQIMRGPDRQEEREYVRNYAQKRLTSTNDLEALYARSRNALFEYWEKNYGLFGGQQ